MEVWGWTHLESACEERKGKDCEFVEERWRGTQRAAWYCGRVSVVGECKNGSELRRGGINERGVLGLRGAGRSLVSIGGTWCVKPA